MDAAAAGPNTSGAAGAPGQSSAAVLNRLMAREAIKVFSSTRNDNTIGCSSITLGGSMRHPPSAQIENSSELYKEQVACL